MNKKEREQLLRDTLDQCLSGLDSLPSDRAEVNRRLAENAPEITHRIRFRRLAVPAVALVLCACLVITGTHLGLIPWPDRIRPQEARITVAPVALAQPAGEGTENPESPAGEELVPILSLTTDVPLDRIRDLDYLTALFFGAWQQGDPSGMRSRTGVQAENPEYTPVTNTFSTLADSFTPETLYIESISGTESDPVRTVTAVCGMKDSSSSYGLYRFHLDFISREGKYFLDFRSLHSFDQLDADGEKAIRSITWPCLFARYVDPVLADRLVPLNLVSEDKGIRFEVLSAAAGTDDILFVWSLQGPEENSGNLFLADIPPRLRCDMLAESWTSASLKTYYDELAKTAIVVEEYHCPGLNLGDADSITLALDPVPVVSTETIDLTSYYRQYGDNAQEVDIPSSSLVNFSPDPDLYRKDVLHVLDYTHPLDIRLMDHVLLSGIGYVDGCLHVQLHFVDNEITYPASDGGWPCQKSVSLIHDSWLSAIPFQWSEIGTDFSEESWVEYTLWSVENHYSIPVTIITTDKYIAGGWSVDVPVSAIRAADSSAAEAEAREKIENSFTGFFEAWKANNINTMLELCSPAWVSAQENSKIELFNILQNRTPSTFTVESVSGTSGDTARMVYAVVTMDYNDHKPAIDLRMTVRMVRENGAWYVDPESLVSYKKIPTPEPEAVPSPEPDPEAALSASEFLPDESPVDVSKKISDTQLLSLRPDLQDQLFPVNLYWTDGTIRLKVVSAAVGETESWVIYILENGSLTDYDHLTNILDDSPLSGPDITEHYELGLIPAKSTKYYAARIRHSQPDPERKAVVFSVSDIENMVYRSIDDMKSLLISYEGLSGDLVDLPDSTMFISTVDGKDISPKEFRESGRKILDSTHSPHVFLANGLELSGIRLEENGMLHIQVHYRMTPDESGDGMARKPVHLWYFSYDIEALDRTIYRILLQDPAESGAYYSEYILPWTMEDFDNLKLSIELLELDYSFPGPLTLEISRPE